MSWWIWVLLALALLGLELLTPGGFFVFFFGLAALAVGGLAALGLVHSLSAELLLFSVLTLASIVLFRRRLQTLLKVNEGRGVGTETLIGEVAILLDDLPAGSVGKAELRGTAWNVRSEASQPLPRGQRCRVERVDGLMLWVKRE